MATKKVTETEPKEDEKPVMPVLTRMQKLQDEIDSESAAFNTEVKETLDIWGKVYETIEVSKEVKTRLRKLLGENAEFDSKESKPRTPSRKKEEKREILKPFFDGKDTGSKFLLSDLRSIIPEEWEIPTSTSPSVLFGDLLDEFATKSDEKDGLAFYWIVK